MADCGRCHLPSTPPSSVRALFPMETAVIGASFSLDIPPGRGEAFVAALLGRVRDQGVRDVPPGTPGAAPVAVEVSASVERGATEDGTPFLAVRARAVLRVHRARVVVESRPAVGRDRDACLGAALADLLVRTAEALTL